VVVFAAGLQLQVQSRAGRQGAAAVPHRPASDRQQAEFGLHVVKCIIVLLVPLLVGLSGVPAWAAEVPAAAVIGNGYALGCFEAATRRRPLREALRLCDKALLDKGLPASERAATLVNRGIIKMQAQKLDAALADYDAAIRLAPDNAEAWINKGIALVHIGSRDDEAVALITEGIARGPKQPAVAYYSRAVAYEGLGRPRQAYEDYSRAAQLDPDWTEPAEQLQRFKVVRGKTMRG
jgi:tetratricopeptide (TPR) repeat protein